jgi:hypothetical protein
MSLNSFRQDAMPQNFLTDQIPGTHCSQETKHLLQDPSLYNHNMIKKKERLFGMITYQYP